MNRYKVDGEVWFRESTQEWILEISGSIKGTSFSARHTQPWHVPPEDVAGLGSTYERIEHLEDALRKIARWHGEFPPSGSKWEDGSEMSYSAAHGSNGERDYMRNVATSPK